MAKTNHARQTMHTFSKLLVRSLVGKTTHGFARHRLHHDQQKYRWPLLNEKAKATAWAPKPRSRSCHHDATQWQDPGWNMTMIHEPRNYFCPWKQPPCTIDDTPSKSIDWAAVSPLASTCQYITLMIPFQNYHHHFVFAKLLAWLCSLVCTTKVSTDDPFWEPCTTKLLFFHDESIHWLDCNLDHEPWNPNHHHLHNRWYPIKKLQPGWNVWNVKLTVTLWSI